MNLEINWLKILFLPKVVKVVNFDGSKKLKKKIKDVIFY